MSTYSKPLPKPTEVSRPFWEAARRHELMLQRCAQCEAFFYYPRPFCPACGGSRLEWRKVCGRGRVHSFTVVRRAASRAFADAAYVVAIVELEEGPRLTTNIVSAPEQVRVEQPVQVYFDDVTPDCTLVKFKPVD